MNLGHQFLLQILCFLIFAFLLPVNAQAPNQNPPGNPPAQNQPPNFRRDPLPDFKKPPLPIDKKEEQDLFTTAYLPQILGGLLVIIVAGTFTWFKTRKKDRLFDVYLKKIHDLKTKILETGDNTARRILLKDLEDLKEQVKFDLARKKIDLEQQSLILEKIEGLLTNLKIKP